jgi:hypothetical protein
MQATAEVQVEFIPDEHEDDDLETIAIAHEAAQETQRELSQNADLEVGLIADNTRNGLIFQVGQALAEHQAEIQVWIGLLLTTAKVLSSHRRVKKVEVKVGDTTLVVEDADRATVERLRGQLETMQAEQLKQASIKASVSKKNKN